MTRNPSLLFRVSKKGESADLAQTKGPAVKSTSRSDGIFANGSGTVATSCANNFRFTAQAASKGRGLFRLS
jgi:hypothetical protein